MAKKDESGRNGEQLKAFCVLENVPAICLYVVIVCLRKLLHAKALNYSAQLFVLEIPFNSIQRAIRFRARLNLLHYDKVSST